MPNIHALLIASTIALGGASQAMAAQDKVIAELNGQQLTENQLLAFTQGQTENAQALLDDPTKRSQAIDAFIDREILYHTAISQKLDQDPEIKSQLEEIHRRLLSQALLQQVAADNPISDADIKTYYDEQIEKLSGSEYLLHHILLNNEEDAAAAIERLDNGEDFAALAEELSQDVSAQQGGRIGWLPLQAMPGAMAAAVPNIKVESYGPSPIKSDHGWHVIKVADTRPTQPPPLERVRPQIENTLRAERLNDYLDELRESAKIKLK